MMDSTVGLEMSNVAPKTFQDGRSTGHMDWRGGAISEFHIQPLLPAIVGNGLRALANLPAERDLLARLEFTAFQRRARALYSCKDMTASASSYWFRHTIGGIDVGISEGVVLGGKGIDIAGWAPEIAAANRCGILRLATASVGELPGKSTQVESLGSSRKWAVRRVRMKLDEVLRLAPDWEQTLAGLGGHTRRNIRKARKLATVERIAFSFLEGATSIPDDLLNKLARRTKPHPIGSHRMNVLEAYADQTGRPFRSMLRDVNGEIISYCCGFLGQSVAYMVYQLNDSERNGIGPSLMHRAFLLEALIQRSCKEVVFVHGCSGISCLPMIADHYWIVRRTPAAWLRVAMLANLLPDTLLGKISRATR